MALTQGVNHGVVNASLGEVLDNPYVHVAQQPVPVVVGILARNSTRR